MGADPGGTGGHVPQRFWRLGTQYQMSPTHLGIEHAYIILKGKSGAV